jgi:hypothetical protein
MKIILAIKLVSGFDWFASVVALRVLLIWPSFVLRGSRGWLTILIASSLIILNEKFYFVYLTLITIILFFSRIFKLPSRCSAYF